MQQNVRSGQVCSESVEGQQWSILDSCRFVSCERVCVECVEGGDIRTGGVNYMI